MMYFEMDCSDRTFTSRYHCGISDYNMFEYMMSVFVQNYPNAKFLDMSVYKNKKDTLYEIAYEIANGYFVWRIFF